jgi:general stress protein 26
MLSVIGLQEELSMKRLIAAIRQGIGDFYKAHTLRHADLSVDRALSVARRMCRKSSYALLITNEAGQSPTARLIQPIVDLQNLDIWMGTNPSLRKVAQIQADNRVSIAFLSEKEHANLILYGRCDVVKDAALNKKYWMPSWSLFFPKGPLSRDYVNLHFTPERMELMNFGQKIVMEPFGLKPLVLLRRNGEWVKTD